MKIFLLDSPSWPLFDPRMHTHLGLMYLAGSLRAAGFTDVMVKDCHQVTSPDPSNRNGLIIHQDKLEPCDVLGLSATTANVHWGQQLAKAWPAKVKVLGGTHVTHIFHGPHGKFKQKKYFEGFDYLMVGEAEEAFVDFCRAVDSGREPVAAHVPNLRRFGPLGCEATGERAQPDVTQLFGPAFDLWEAGFRKGALAGPTARASKASEMMTASLDTARGCPYACTFCADARTKLREETLAQIEAEVKQLAELGVQAIRVQDDTYTIKAERAKAIADILHAYGMVWRGTTRVNLVDSSLFRYLASKGCTELGFGIEHGSAKMLKLMAKGTTPQKNEIGVKQAQDAGIIPRSFLMIGFPGETEETIAELEEWVLRVRPGAVTMSLFTPYPGSDVWNNPVKYGVAIPDNAFDRFWQLGNDNDPNSLVLDLPTISKERLFYHRQRLIKLFSEEIGSLDRARLHGNVGTFGPQVLNGGLNSDCVVG